MTPDIPVRIIEMLQSAAIYVGVPLMILWGMVSAIRLGLAGGNESTEKDAKRGMFLAAAGIIAVLAIAGILKALEAAMQQFR